MMLFKYVLFAIICLVIWVVNCKWLSDAIKNRVVSEIYMHIGLGVFFTVLALEWILGNTGLWYRLDIQWLRSIGLILYIPAGLLIIASFVELHKKGESKSRDVTDTTAFINTGIYSIIRQPMTLGMAIFSIAITLIFQSLISLITQIVALFCFLISAAIESKYNIKKFGSNYEEYMKKVPMWNIFKGFINKT